MRKKVLIVKLGYTETIDHRVTSDNISLGDIFRTTAILHLFKDSSVTWLTTREGLSLLSGNHYIERILIYEATTAFQLQAEYFDIVINLEKMPGICALVDSIKASRKYGFRFDSKRGRAEAYEYSYEVLANSEDPELRRKLKKNWTEILYEMLGKKWRGQGCVMAYRPKTREKFDVGFNTNVGKRWPNKAWPKENWEKLEKLIDNRFTISYQQSLRNIDGYIDWLNSCRLIITNDSLGLHLAIALNKKIIVMFGPTSEKEIFLFNGGIVVRPEKRLKCMPCFDTVCKYDRSCIYDISPEVIYTNIVELLK